MDVKVKNRDLRPAKDVVQLYYTAPYDPAGDGKAIEKAHVVLGDFKKTKLLAAGEEQILTLSIKVRDMASYDYNDENKNDLASLNYKVSDEPNDPWFTN